MNPFNSFTGGGANFVCIFCGISNEVPNTYFQYCDASGQRMVLLLFIFNIQNIPCYVIIEYCDTLMHVLMLPW